MLKTEMTQAVSSLVKYWMHFLMGKNTSWAQNPDHGLQMPNLQLKKSQSG